MTTSLANYVPEAAKTVIAGSIGVNERCKALTYAPNAGSERLVLRRVQILRSKLIAKAGMIVHPFFLGETGEFAPTRDAQRN